MKILLKYKQHEYMDAHKLAATIKSLTGQRYTEIVKTQEDNMIVFNNIFCSNRVIDSVPGIVEKFQQKQD